ncbi:MAG: hypothetical protein GX591_12235 [Planctomycetes bacterium]|nr:hypothetical protein [Planctomycetota bacterium]
MYESSKGPSRAPVVMAVAIALGLAVGIVAFCRLRPSTLHAAAGPRTGPRQRTAAPAPSLAPAAAPAANVEAARQRSMLSSLQTLRSQVVLYTMQHNGAPPGLQANGGIDPDDFIRDLTGRTDAAGLPAAAGGRTFGPYLQAMAANPFVEGPASLRVTIGPGPCPGDGTSGWYYETDTQALYPNHPGWSLQSPLRPSASTGQVRRRPARVSDEAREAVLKSDLQLVRSQIELYRAQHVDLPPGRQADGSIDAADFERDLLGPTDRDGRAVARGGRALGPYLQRMPVNPFVDASVCRTVKVGPLPCPGDGTSGWYYETGTGRFSANDAAHKHW